MGLRLQAVTFDARDPARLAHFWADMLGRRCVDDTENVLLPGDQTQVGLRFTSGHIETVGPDYLHLHLTSSSPTEQQQTVETALRLGSHHLDVGQRPEEGHLVLADPEGNPFCVIEPGNSYLAGCGLLGELACDGTRDVGLFWSAALGWPMVWDQDQETAIQSPHGGTKIAWGGSQDTPKQGRERQRFDLIAPSSNQDTEVERLMSLGAARLGINQARVVAMTDPDGKQFSVRAG